MSRSRSKGTTRSVPYQYRYRFSCPGSDFTSWTNGGSSLWSDSNIQFMTDENHGKRSSYRNIVGNCSQTKWLGSITPVTGYSYKYGNCPGITPPQSKIVTYEISPGWSPGTMPPSPDSNPSGWISKEAWCDSQLRALVESIPMNVSVPNFFLELGDVRNLPSQIRDIGSSLKDAVRSRSLRDILKGSANAYLLKTFGIDSMIRDIKSIIYGHERAIKRLNWLRKNNNKWVSVSRTRTGDVKIGSSGTYIYSLPFNGEPVLRRKECTMRVTEKVGAKSYLSFSGLDAHLAEMSAIRESFGFNRPFAIIWESVPLSWAVDYFIRISDWIDRIPIDSAFQGVPCLAAPYWWRKTSVKYSVYWEWDSGVNYDQNSLHGAKAVDAVYTTFSRSPVIPSTYAPPMVAGSLSGSQITNLAALLTQRGL